MCTLFEYSNFINIIVHHNIMRIKTRLSIKNLLVFFLFFALAFNVFTMNDRRTRALLCLDVSDEAAIYGLWLMKTVSDFRAFRLDNFILLSTSTTLKTLKSTKIARIFWNYWLMLIFCWNDRSLRLGYRPSNDNNKTKNRK